MDNKEVDQKFMSAAFEQAHTSFQQGGIPIGAVLVDGSGEIVGSGHNERVQRLDPIAHGEMACFRNAGRRTSYVDCTMYTTLAPCSMCAGAIRLFKVPRVVVGENVTFPGDLELLEKSGVAVTLLNDTNCQELMERFVTAHPEIWNEDIGV